MCGQKGFIDWQDAPHWAQYCAMDGDGEWYWYENKPHESDGVWFATGEIRFAGRSPDGDLYKKSLVSRPHKVPSWSDAPEWARYTAQDGDGQWFWYEYLPEHSEEGWSTNGSWNAAVSDVPNASWKTTLIPRPTPDWSDLLSSIVWIAQDKDGDWYGYTNKPQLSGDFWDEPETGEVEWISSGPENPSWRDSLQSRPGLVGKVVSVDENNVATLEINVGGDTIRQTVLEAAIDAVTRDRNRDYGDPEDNFNDIADLWNAYLGNRVVSPLTPSDVGVLNILQKIARQKVSPHVSDHYTDIAGYAACVAEINQR